MDPETGLVSGNPKTARARTIYKVTATNSGGSDSVDLKLTVHESALSRMLAIAENEQHRTET